MEESEAKEFIRKQVSIELANRFWKGLSILGIANLVALVGLYWSVLSTTRQAAEGQAAKTAKEYVDRDASLSRLVEETQKKQSENIITSQGDIAVLQTNIEHAKTAIGAFTELAGKVDSKEQQRISRLILELNKHESVTQILDLLQQLKPAIEELQSSAEKQKQEIDGRIGTLETAVAPDTPGSAVRNIHLLAAADVKPLWYPHLEGDSIKSRSTPENPVPITAERDGSIEIDLSREIRVPVTSRGVILKVTLRQDGKFVKPNGTGAGSLLFSDHTGQFPSSTGHQGNGITNDTESWIGGIVIAPFSSGRKVRCRATPGLHTYGTLLGYYD